MPLLQERVCCGVSIWGQKDCQNIIRDALRVPVVTAVWLLGGGATWPDPSHSLREEGGRLVRVEPGIRLKSLKQTASQAGTGGFLGALSCGGRGRKEER